MIYYKIRKRDDPELYVKGTPSYMGYDKSGRLFQTLGQLRSFLSRVIKNSHSNKVADWEIVEIETSVKCVKGVHEMITGRKLKELLIK